MGLFDKFINKKKLEKEAAMVQKKDDLDFESIINGTSSYQSMTEDDLKKINEETAAYRAKRKAEDEAKIKIMAEHQAKMNAINANMRDILNNYYASSSANYQNDEEVKGKHR